MEGYKRGTVLGLALVLLLWVLCPAARAAESRFGQPELTLPCKAAVLMEETTGTVLYAQNPDIQLPIASITKVMTLLLTLEAMEAGKVGLQDLVPVSAHAYGMGGSQIWLEPGEQFTLEEMLKAICVSSANDAAVAVAEFIGGSEEVFVEMMNAKAAELGMQNTHFCNACGLDAEGHLSSARDVAIMSREMLEHHKEITQYTTIWTDTLRGGATLLTNTNKLLRSYNGINGLKTGTTSKAGVCISASATRDDLSLIAVVLGSASSEERFAAATTLLDYGFANFACVDAPLPPDAPQSLPVARGSSESVALEYRAPGKLLLRKGEEQEMTAVLDLPQRLQAPVAQGQQVGSVTIQGAGVQLGSYGVFAQAEVPLLDFGAALRRIARGLVAG